MMKVFVDIDETICYYEGSREYSRALPVFKNINKINLLYDGGHHITYWSARGTTTGKDWHSLTERQLSRWGCKYHHLSVGEKPPYDLLICDKSKRIEEV
jgi:hypothetical protein